MKKLKMSVLMSAAVAVLLIGCPSCTTTERTVTVDANGNAVTNVVKTFDPVKTAQVKAALEVPIKDGIRRVLAKSPQHSDEIAKYIREFGIVFCGMRDSGKFDPQVLIDEGAKIGFPLLDKESQDIAALIKDTGQSLYKIFWAERFQADLPADKFMFNVADFFCTSIDEGLKTAGKPGVK